MASAMVAVKADCYPDYLRYLFPRKEKPELRMLDVFLKLVGVKKRENA